MTEKVEPTNLLGKGVAAAAKYINAVNINAVNINAVNINAVSINAVNINAYEDDDFTPSNKIGQLRGKCFIAH